MQGPIITQFPQPADSGAAAKSRSGTEKKALDLVQALSDR